MLERCTALLSEPWICHEKFSVLLKGKRVVAWCLRFINKVQVRREERLFRKLNECEIQKTEEGFPHEVMALKSGHSLPVKSPLRQLNPVLDSDGFLRVKGPSELAKHLPSETKNPTLLPKKHCMTTLIVAYHHEQRNHCAKINQVLSDIQTRIWIIRGREAVK